MKGINLLNLCRANKWPEVRKYLSSNAAEEEKKSNIMYRDHYWGRTSLYAACYRDTPDDIVEAMINIGGKELVMKADDYNNDTALHYACINGFGTTSYNIIKMLIEVGGKDLVMAKNNDGNTALHRLCLCIKSHTKDAEKVKLILQVGDANLLLSTKNRFGQTPLEIGKGASKEIQKLLTVQSNSKRKPGDVEHQEEGEGSGAVSQSQSSKRSRIGNAADTGSKVKLEVGLKGKLEVGSKIKLEAESKENFSERANATSSSSGNLILDKVPSPSSTSDGIQPTRWSNRARKPSARSHEDLMSIPSIFDIPIPLMEPSIGESLNIVGKRTLPSSNENQLTVRKSSPVSKPPVVGNFKVFCKISRNDSVLESTYSDASAFTSSFNIGFMTLPCSSTSTFADARSTMLSDLDEDCLPHKWKFFVPYLGPMSIKQEARSGSILQFLKNTTHGDQFGDGTAKKPFEGFHLRIQIKLLEDWFEVKSVASNGFKMKSSWRSWYNTQILYCKYST
jgi:hypothetical protein